MLKPGKEDKTGLPLSSGFHELRALWKIAKTRLQRLKLNEISETHGPHCS